MVILTKNKYGIVVGQLIEMGASIEPRDSRGRSLVDIAFVQDDVQMIENFVKTKVPQLT